MAGQYDPGTSMIALYFSRTELELLVKALEVSRQAGWPIGDDTVRVSTLKAQIEKAISGLRNEGWQGFRQ